ncbi:MAG TPA: pyridoxal 5'-phosphate synthase glutaminase subunit PdxT [Treponemataceae bacterium]|jgi:5'-phosphate synthase pdxT subunit|nr:pyridoxal 5'-phosphate synthase glutaminase subunit PdxT [Treponemataceae bacterium]
MAPTIGVLALQGGFASHRAAFGRLGAEAREIRTATDLEGIDALVIPGGESTTLTKLLMESDWEPGAPPRPGRLWHALRDFARERPTMGTCAGLILLARDSGDPRVVPLDVLPITVTRNAYGRQAESFVAPVTLAPECAGGNPDRPFPATFIRAPRIASVETGVVVLAREGVDPERGAPIMVRFGSILGLTFHPELNPEDDRVHRYFLKELLCTRRR